MKQMHMAESVLNRILNFLDDLEAPLVADPASAELDAAITAPAPDMPPVDGIEEALVEKGLGLAPPA